MTCFSVALPGGVEPHAVGGDSAEMPQQVSEGPVGREGVRAAAIWDSVPV